MLKYDIKTKNIEGAVYLSLSFLRFHFYYILHFILYN
jgi:hypothetical protein